MSIDVLLWASVYIVSMVVIVLVKPSITSTKGMDYALLYEVLLFILLPIVAVTTSIRYWRRSV